MTEDEKSIPRHLGVIMVGSRRWARERGLSDLEGYRAGAESLHNTLHACLEIGIEFLTVYAYSAEDEGQPQGEVGGTAAILESVIDTHLAELHERGVQVRHIGYLGGIGEALQRKVRDALELTRDNDVLVMNVAVNYQGRAEILEACRRMIGDGVAPDDVDEDMFGQYLFTAGQPDADLIVRTGGEFRVSNLLLWQGAYAEYYVTPILWPDFDRAELERAIAYFGQRERRFGVLK